MQMPISNYHKLVVSSIELSLHSEQPTVNMASGYMCKLVLYCNTEPEPPAKPPAKPRDRSRPETARALDRRSRGPCRLRGRRRYGIPGSQRVATVSRSRPSRP